MRSLAAIAGVALVTLVATPALAEFPWAVRAAAGAGFGFAGMDGLGAGPFSASLAADCIWRRERGSGLVLSFDAAVTGFVGGRSLVYRERTTSLDACALESITIGPERHRSAPGTGYFGHWGVGLGRIHDESHSGDPRRFYGAAFTAATGVRVVPDPGPLGLTLGLRTSHVIADRTHQHAIVAFIGITIDPLATNEPVLASH